MSNKRRALGVVAAVVLAAIGTVGLVAYVQDARNEAVAGERRVKVLVTTTDVPAGTPASALTDKVKVTAVPAKVAADGAVRTLKQLKGKVTTADLVAGEQLVRARFAADGTATLTRTRRGVPEGFFGATVALDPEQALGGLVRPGDRVAVVGFTDPRGADLGQAVVLAEGVLVTAVQIDGERGDTATNDDDSDKDTKVGREVVNAPTGKFFVSLALTREDLEKVVTATNAGKVWLATDAGTR
jgi:pilus assembly protein CpaB